MAADSQALDPEGTVSRLPAFARPRVSVVIPLYNKAHSIGATLSSVLAQTVTDFEAIIVNDGSTDGSAAIVRKFGDGRVRLIEQNNAGAGAARNRGIKEARSDLVAFLDADDIWLPHFLETALALHSRFPRAGAYATAFVALHEGKLERFLHALVSNRLGGEVVEDYFRSCVLGSSMVGSSSVVIPTYVFDRVGCFPVGVRNGEDLHMWARIALEFPIAWSALECAIWNLDAENRTAGRILMTDVPFAGLLENAVAEGRVPAGQVKWVRAYIAKFRIYYAAVSIAHGKRVAGWKLLWLARNAPGTHVEWCKTAFKALVPQPLVRSLQSRRRRSRMA